MDTVKTASILIVLAWYAFNLLVTNSSIGFILLGFALVFLVPGYSWIDSLAKTEDQLERFVLAVALSISLVILSIVWMNLVFKIQINQTSIFADIVLISLAGLVWENRGLVGFGQAPPVKKTLAKKKRAKSSKKTKKK